MIRPLSDRILVRPDAGETVTKGGLLLPETAVQKPLQGKVLAIGKGKTVNDGTRVEVDVILEDTVLYGKHVGTKVTAQDGEELLILKEEEILAVMEK